MDLCFELATRIMERIGDVVSPIDEVHGFKYFDDRDLLGFVDGTENPRGQAVTDAARAHASGDGSLRLTNLVLVAAGQA